MIVVFVSVILNLNDEATIPLSFLKDRRRCPRMHTTICTTLPAWPRRVWLPLLLVQLLAGSLSPAAAQPEFPGTPNDQGINVRVYPADFWTPRVGPGIGAGLVVHNLARKHDQWLFTAAPAQHEQVATASFASANPQLANQYVLVDARALHTNRHWLGPPSDRAVLERSSLRARVRLGQTWFDRVLVQPQITVEYHRVQDVDAPSTGTAVSDPLPLPNSTKTGARLGVDLQYDARDQPAVTTRGVLLQGTWNRYVPLDDAGLHFDQVEIDAYGYVPLGGVHRFATRLSSTLTVNRGTAPVPVYMLPTIGGAVSPGWPRGRFVAPDRLLASVLYRFPLLHYENLLTLEGHVGGHLAGSYDDVGNQFSTTLSFENPPSPNESTRPLRPSVSTGLRIAMPRRQDLELAVGISPAGISAVRFSLVRTLQALRPPHHSSENVR